MPWGPSSTHTGEEEVVRSEGGGEAEEYILCVTFMPHTWKTTRWRCFSANSVTLITPAYFVAHSKSAYEPIVIVCK